MKKITQIPFAEIGSIPQLIRDFLGIKNPEFAAELFTVSNIPQKIKAKAAAFSVEKREVLAEVFRSGFEGFALSGAQQKNLENLQLADTFTVTTGHQLNLFTGSAFFIYKILQTIKTAEFLAEKFPAKNFVPVFWLATEDHDFEEIDHFRTENGFYQMTAKNGNAVGRITAEDQSFIQNFKAEFNDSVFGTELIRLMKTAYKPGNSLAQATKTVVQHLFSEYGLLFIDGDERALKSEMKETFRDELLNFSLQKNAQRLVENLSHEYGKVQVNPREINLFYLNGETRNRIEFRDGDYHIVDTDQKFSQAEILDELERFPEKFSPNALMRPVYQETVLPNITYIGGNAEIMYWLELKDYFKKLALPFPSLVPRNSMLFLSEKTFRKMERLGVSPQDLAGDFATLLREKYVKNDEIEELLNNLEASLEEQFAQLEAAAGKTDISFKNLADAEKTRQLKSFRRMRKRLWRAERIKQKEKVERLEDLFRKVHPGGSWQERVLNFSVFYADFGNSWISDCYAAMDPQKSELIIMEY